MHNAHKMPLSEAEAAGRGGAGGAGGAECLLYAVTNATLLPASSFAFGATKHCADMQQAERERGQGRSSAGGGRRGTGPLLPCLIMAEI